MFPATSSVKCLNVVGVTVRKHSTVPSKTFTRGKIDLNGIFLPIPTPFQENQQQRVDYEKLKENLLKWEKSAFKGSDNLNEVLPLNA